MGRTCGEPDEIKKNTHPKCFTALFREQDVACEFAVVVQQHLKTKYKKDVVVDVVRKLVYSGKQGEDEKAVVVVYDAVDEPTFRKGKAPKTTELVIETAQRRQTMAAGSRPSRSAPRAPPPARTSR